MKARTQPASVVSINHEETATQPAGFGRASSVMTSSSEPPFPLSTRQSLYGIFPKTRFFEKKSGSAYTGID